MDFDTDVNWYNLVESANGMEFNFFEQLVTASADGVTHETHIFVKSGHVWAGFRGKFHPDRGPGSPRFVKAYYVWHSYLLNRARFEYL